MLSRAHAMPFGAELRPAAGTRFRIWAPDARRVELQLEGATGATRLPLLARAEGWFHAEVSEAAPGDRYRFVIDGGFLVPDPASRFQPEGVHGPSEVVDPRAFAWSDGDWRGRPWEQAVIYELHVGAFTPQGGYAGVCEHLDHLSQLGVTGLELMPLAECPGARNWGYDGVLPFAPEQRYGRPEALKTLVQEAHARGLMVLLDVVYNHFGPEGNHLSGYASRFFTRRHATPWGAAIDFESEASRPVRDFFIHNALYWLEEYHLDGLRLDAVHAIHDRSAPDLLTELAESVHDRLGAERFVHLVLENDRNEARRLTRDSAGRPRLFAAQWNDDFHHSAHVLLTGETDGYYAEHARDPFSLLARCLVEGFAWQGQPSPHRDGAPRGEPSAELPPGAFVTFLQNHDQVGNRAFGERLTRLVEPAALEAGAALLLLAPSTPLLFMGEEWGCEQPFPFFCDFGPELAEAVRAGRRREFASFPAFRDESARERIPDPGAPQTFASAVLRWEDLDLPRSRQRLALFTRLLEIRQRELAPRLCGIGKNAAAWEHLGARALRAHWRLGDGARLHLLANLAARAAPGASRPPGRRLFAVPEDLAEWRDELPPWTVAWHLEAVPGEHR